MGREKVLITVKTYPTLSRKHGELVCTAGVREDGSWVRLYPIPFRLLDYKDRYQKFDWIETRLVRNTKDPRPETFHPADTSDIQQVGRMETTDNWRERRDARQCLSLEPFEESAAGGRNVSEISGDACGVDGEDPAPLFGDPLGVHRLEAEVKLRDDEAKPFAEVVDHDCLIAS